MKVNATNHATDSESVGMQQGGTQRATRVNIRGDKGEHKAGQGERQGATGVNTMGDKRDQKRRQGATPGATRVNTRGCGRGRGFNATGAANVVIANVYSGSYPSF